MHEYCLYYYNFLCYSAPWKKIFNWAADLAKKQDNVSVKFAEAISNLDLASTSDELKNFVTKDDNTTKLTAQDMFSQTVLSDTLRVIIWLCIVIL